MSVARCHTSSKDLPSTVVLMREKSGNESLNARISIEPIKVKSLAVANRLDGLCTHENLVISSQRVEHQDRPNNGSSETKYHGGK